MERVPLDDLLTEKRVVGLVYSLAALPGSDRDRPSSSHDGPIQMGGEQGAAGGDLRAFFIMGLLPNILRNHGVGTHRPCGTATAAHRSGQDCGGLPGPQIL